MLKAILSLLFSIALVLMFGGKSVEYVAEPLSKPVEAFDEVATITTLSLEEKIKVLEAEFGLRKDILWNLAFSESRLGEDRIGDSGKSCGVIHFHKDYYPEENSRCDDDDYILRRAAEMIANGEEWKFTPCSCVQQARAMGAKLPKGNANDLFPNSTEIPAKGGVVILKYWNPDRHHIAYIEKVTAEGLYIVEGNFKPCLVSRRFIEHSSKHIMGFYKDTNY